MKNQLGKFREIAGKGRKYDFGLAGSQPEEKYDAHLLNDPSYEKKSVYVPDDIKKKINSWAEDMGLTPKKEKNMKELRNYIRQLVIETLGEIEEKDSKEKDVTGDGEADFTDVMASRMMASGMSKDKAVKKAEKTVSKHQKK